VRSRLITVAAVLAGLVAVPAAAGPAAGIDGAVTVSYVVPTRDAQIYLEVVRTDLARQGRPRTGDLHLLAVLGARPQTAMPTTGCRRVTPVRMRRHRHRQLRWLLRLRRQPREAQTGHDVVEWISRQRWTTGKVGMLGGSYDGTTQYATAVTHRVVLQRSCRRRRSAVVRLRYAGGMRYTDTDETWATKNPS